MPSVEDILLRVTGESRDAESSLNRVAREVADLGRKKAIAEVQLRNIGLAEGQLARMKQQLDALDGMKVKPEVQIEVDRAKADLALLERELETLFNRIASKRSRGEILDANELRDLANLLQRVGRESGNVGRTLSRAAGPVSNLNQQFTGMLGAVKQVNPILSGLGILMTTALIPAFIALASAIGAAIVAIGALGTALAAAAGPAAVVLIAVFARLAKIIEAYQKYSQAADSETRQGAQERANQLTQLEALHDAQIQVRDSTQAVTAAQRTLREAQRAATDAIAEANTRVADSVRQMAVAAESGYAAMELAAEEARDAVLSLERAQLSAEQADLNRRQAIDALKDMRNELGLTSDSFDDLFKKFTDVDFKGDISGLLAGAVGGDVNSDQRLELEQLILDVKDAKLGEKEATEGVRDAEDELGAARARNNEFLAKGLAAYEPYVEAVRANASAVRELAKLERLGVSGAPAVIAAREALRDAIERQREAVHNLNVEQRQQKLDPDTGPQALYADLRSELSGVERQLLDLFIAISKNGDKLRETFGPATDAFFSGLIDSIKLAALFAYDLRDVWTGIGEAMGNAFRSVSLNLFVGMREQLRRIGTMVPAVIGGLTRGFNDFLGIIGNIGEAAMPHLIDMLDFVNDGLQRFRERTSNIGGVQSQLTPFMEILKEIIRFLAASADGIFQFLEASAPAAKDLMKYLTGVAKRFADWASSEEGRERIAEFFEDTLPMVKSFLKMVASFIKAFLAGLQAISPALKVVFDAFAVFGDILTGFFDLLNKIPAPIRAIPGYFAPIGGIITKVLGFFGKLATGVLNAFKKVGGFIKDGWGRARELFSAFSGFIRGFGERIANAFSNIVGGFRGAFDRVKSVVTGGFNIVKGLFTRFVTFIKGVATPIFTAIKGAFDKAKQAFDFFRGVLSTAWGWAKDLVGKIVDVFKGAFNAVPTALLNAFTAIKDVFIGSLNFIIDLLNEVIRTFNDVTPGAIKIAGETIVPGVPDIPEIPRLAKGGVAMRRTFAEIGEAGREAVLPLRGRGLSTVAGAVAGALTRALAPSALAGAGGGSGIIIENLNLPPAPGHNQIGDARAQAIQLARELERRGGGGPTGGH